jgi:hypothetical protein
MTILQTVRNGAVLLTLCFLPAVPSSQAATNSLSDFAAKVAAIRQRGQPTTLAELEQWGCPATTNENAGFVYQQAFAKLVRPSTNDSPKLPVEGELAMPRRTNPFSEDTRLLMQEFLATNSAAQMLLDRAERLPAAAYPHGTNELITAFFQDAAGVRAAARLLYLRAILAAEQNHPDEAVTALRGIIPLTRPLDCAPLVIKYLVKTAVESISVTAFERVVNRTTLTDAQLAGLDDLLRETEASDKLQDALIGERAFMLEGFKKPPYSSSSVDLDKELSVVLQIIQDYVDAVGLAYPARWQALERLEDQLPQLTNSTVLAAPLIPAIAGAVIKDVRHNAQLRVARAVIAVERERLKTHSLPGALPDGTPVDPVNGQPLRYKKLKTGYIIYSIGPDMHDDGGDPRKDVPLTVEH